MYPKKVAKMNHPTKTRHIYICFLPSLDEDLKLEETNARILEIMVLEYDAHFWILAVISRFLFGGGYLFFWRLFLDVDRNTRNF